MELLLGLGAHCQADIQPRERQSLNDNQVISHFPNHYELTQRHDGENIKRYFKDLAEKDGVQNVIDYVPNDLSTSCRTTRCLSRSFAANSAQHVDNEAHIKGTRHRHLSRQ